MVNKSWDFVKPALSEAVLACVQRLGYSTMTPVQAATIPLLLSCKDVAAEAVTGSGKTLAFVVPALELVQRRRAQGPLRRGCVYALVVSPTRELAAQTYRVILDFLKEPSLSDMGAALLIGGRPVEDDHTRLQNGSTFVVCTPGRLADLMQDKNLNLPTKFKELELLVLDEADRLLELGFWEVVSGVLQVLPRQRRTALLSATAPRQLQQLRAAGLRNPALVQVREAAGRSTPAALRCRYLSVPPAHKLAALLQQLPPARAMLFLPTCAAVRYWSRALPPLLPRVRVLALHGRMRAREPALQAFREAERALLLCTDVAARGVHVRGVARVLQWGPPRRPAAALHRAGRTARAGLAGDALLALHAHELPYAAFLRAHLQLPLEPLAPAPLARPAARLRRRLHALQRRDRALLDLATRAFVSELAAYARHEASALLRADELPLGELAAAYGLLRLPASPDVTPLHRRQFEPFAPRPPVDFDAIPYADPQRERRRQAALQQRRAASNAAPAPAPGAAPAPAPGAAPAPAPGAAPAPAPGPAGPRAALKRNKPVQNAPWSKAKLDKQQRKQKKQKRKELKEAAGSGGRRKRRRAVTAAEVAELAADAALLRRLRARRISPRDFDRQFVPELSQPR